MESRRNGFTLIELLIVISVIAVLAAILFPVFLTAMKSAKESRCVSNLKQIGAALSLYQQDNGDRYPTAMPWTGAPEGLKPPIETYAETPNMVGYTRVLFRYTRTPDIWVCPSGARKLLKNKSNKCDFPAGGPEALVGWTKLYDGKWVSSNYVSYPLSQVTAPFQDGIHNAYSEYCRGWTPAQAMARWGRSFSPEGNMWKQGYHQPQWNNRLIQDGYTLSVAGLWRPHRKGTNVLFHDGHVARIRDFRIGDDTE